MASEKLAGFEYAVLSRISDIGFLWEKTCKETSLILAAAVMTGCNGELEGVSATAAEEVGVPVDILLFFIYYNNSLICARAERNVWIIAHFCKIFVLIWFPPLFPSQNEISEKYKREFLVQNAP